MKQTLARQIFASLVIILLAGGFFVAPQPVSAELGVCQCPGVTCDAAKGNCATACTIGSTTDCGPSVCGNQTGTCVAGSAGSAGSGTTGGSTSGGAGSQSGGSLTNPLESVCKQGTTGQQCLQLIIGNVIKSALGITGSIALLMIIWGGFLWLTSMGNSERVEKGKNVLIWATLGLVLIFGAYAITSYIIEKLILGK
jgi:hypothetical protein